MNIKRIAKNYAIEALLVLAAGMLGIMFSSDSKASEIEFRVTDMKYNWGENYNFPVTAYQIGLTEYRGGIGVRLMGGQTDTRKNTKGTTHTNQMRDFFVLNIHRKLQLSKQLSIQYGLNYTEYKGGSKGQYNSDSDYGHGLAVQYQLNKKLAVKLSYDQYYEKYKESLGLEETNGVGFSFVGTF